MSYESPIVMYVDKIMQDLEKQTDEDVLNAVIRVGVTVDKDELIKALQYDRDQYEKGYHDGVMTSGWIPCEERLPEEDEDVLVCFKKAKGLMVVHLAYYWDARGVFWEDCFSRCCKLEEVLAWMPLPEPYKEVVE